MNRLKMRNVIHYVIFLAASTFLWGCTDEPGPKVVPEPKWELDLVEDEPDPAWNAPESGIYQFSMTAIIRLSEFLEKYADPKDEVSAFVGNECRGIATVQDNGKKLFFLYIRGNQGETQKVTLKYYSAKNKKTYTCQDFLVFEQNGTYGKVSAPAVPPFEESGKYPETMTAVVSLPEALPFERRDKDILAAFVGDECRGVGELTEAGGKVYQFEIRGKKDETAAVYYMYYSMQASGVYKAAESFPFADEGVQGTLDAPFPITLQPVVE
ncbi:hypothetical protein [uncultured Parabacteroides sp.]|uniref:hypothetical protein n=2 Tax=uncultured Parabacteroides sp. TaxID=512312 RepID=UPI0025CC737F|nr:hypothetical protein [uncultured Parabacteroides sp.]